MQLRLPTPEQLRTVYHQDMKRSFPETELRPLWSIEAMWEKGQYRPYCLFDDDDIQGECFLWLAEPGYAILDYLCVSPRIRNGGLGAKILHMIREKEPDLVLFGEAEAPEHAPDPAIAQRRLDFYARNGLRTAGYDTEAFGAHYKTLYLADSEVPDEVLMRQHRFLYERCLSRELLDKYVRIPKEPAEPVGPAVSWAECETYMRDMARRKEGQNQ